MLVGADGLRSRGEREEEQQEKELHHGFKHNRA
jgi:hypothetical protein